MRSRAEGEIPEKSRAVREANPDLTGEVQSRKGSGVRFGENGIIFFILSEYFRNIQKKGVVQSTIKLRLTQFGLDNSV